MSGGTEYRSKVYTERPPYADFDPPHKFQAIFGIVMRRLSLTPYVPIPAGRTATF